MKLKHLSVMAVAAAFAACPALAAEPVQKLAAAKKEAEADKVPAEGSQQNKMKTCNDKAKKKELRGDERKQFMSACLKG